MADTAVAITAGSGTNIDTRTEATNGNHRQVIVVGDPATNAGVAPVDATTGLVVNIGPGVDLGSGTGGSKTPRVLIDSAQLGSLGRAAIASSSSVVHAGYEYETVAASQSAQVLGATGAAGDMLYSIIITPATTTPGDVTILDNATTLFVWSPGTLTSKASVQYVLNLTSVSGAWKITTGANVQVVGIGDFT